MEKKKHKIIRRIVLITVSILLFFFIVIMPAATLFTYNQVFGMRYSTPSDYSYSIYNFPGLKADRYQFASNEGQILSAYCYYREEQEVKAVIIMSHGIGAGHNSYMDVADYFTRFGFYVFAYDVTGNDESEGSSIKGLPQGVIDLDYAITYVENTDAFKGLPILLFGHSWGGYSATSVLNEHPEVKAVCSVSGFNKSSDLLQAQGESMVGPAIELMLPYLNLYERIRFGKYAVQTSMDGFEKSDAKVMIIHSEDDKTVPIIYGYDIYYALYSDDPDFVFVRYLDKGHNKILSADGKSAYMNNLKNKYDLRFGKSSPSEEDIAAFYSEVVDADQIPPLANDELLGRVVDFYDNVLNG